MKKFVIIIAILSLSFTALFANENNALSLDKAIAKYEGQYKISEIESLLDEGIDTQDSDGNTALMLVSKYGYTDIVKALISHGTFSTYSIQTYVQSNAERQTYVNIENNDGTSVC